MSPARAAPGDTQTGSCQSLRFAGRCGSWLVEVFTVHTKKGNPSFVFRINSLFVLALKRAQGVYLYCFSGCYLVWLTCP
jgi:hypothetical protein